MRERGFFFLFFSLLLLALKVRGSGYAENGDFFTGTWVLDESYPLYLPSTCPFIEREFRCEGNGRPDLIYTHYRWHPLASKFLRLALSYHFSLFFFQTLFRIITNPNYSFITTLFFSNKIASPFLTQTQTFFFTLYFIFRPPFLNHF